MFRRVMPGRAAVYSSRVAQQIYAKTGNLSASHNHGANLKKGGAFLSISGQPGLDGVTCWSGRPQVRDAPDHGFSWRYSILRVPQSPFRPRPPALPTLELRLASYMLSIRRTWTGQVSQQRRLPRIYRRVQAPSRILFTCHWHRSLSAHRSVISRRLYGPKTEPI